MPTNIFFTGATGYIGGSVLARLLAHPKRGDFKITALVRSEEKAKLLEPLDVTALIGSTDDLELLKKAASDADVVIACTNADDVPAAKAILQGLQLRHEKSKNKSTPVLIHTSGTGVLADNAAGMYATETIYHDSDAAQIESLPDTQAHRDVDLLIVEADKAGYLKSYIILPSTIYGIASNRLVDLKIQNPRSIQIPSLVRASLDRKQGGMVGEGKNLWPNVHIDDVADLYIVLFDLVTSPSAATAVGHGREGFYFGENGEHSLYQIGQAICQSLVQLDHVSSDTPTAFSKEELDKYFGGSDYLGSNSRARGVRSRSIGWKPTKTTEDMLASVKGEVLAELK
ncbi:NAD(P)-binding protein [Athelia psychrophila]|uniref:NAD(P)-binding protein n=1 Tax=Athelia psychrophila TaxID=1759441 RepID=A0A166UGH9_9AGAM|nr:NAD(P)-binding protein [Fibularhizoctonia sp. CBS 109695]